ncbi:hypothetical protein HPT25_27685 [Bacillus sp. BRMEA1]|uniref:hypothetical protein n=1 Tax=Neobacillus endophyticus TaxID=2738405 RepID=UPI0015650C88|nr:hypothetical protein [Neobacillus endophyticus]NRD81078.1 hypothetical protein [Neobacillus endophyticus]
MIKLVVDNTKKNTPKTCAEACSLYDPITRECGIWEEVDVMNPSVYARCQKKQPILFHESLPMGKNASKKIKFTLLEDDFECEFDDQAVFYKLQGDKFDEDKSNYPLMPDFPSERDDAIWYVDPSGTYGSWIVNHSKQKFMSVSNDQMPETGFTSRIYKSPYPLHDHNTSKSLASRMCWYVDEEGFGQYVLLGNGEIMMLSSHKAGK